MDINKIFEMLERSGIFPEDTHEFPTVYRQTGYKRIYPCQIVQDPNVLLKMHTFNYDWTVPEFQTYCRKRGVLCFNIDEWRPYLGKPDYDHIPEMIHVHAAKMQDCWELYLREIMALTEENYNAPPPGDRERLQVLLNTIYK